MFKLISIETSIQRLSAMSRKKKVPPVSNAALAATSIHTLTASLCTRTGDNLTSWNKFVCWQQGQFKWRTNCICNVAYLDKYLPDTVPFQINTLLMYLTNTAIRKDNRDFCSASLIYVKMQLKAVVHDLIQLTDIHRSSLEIFHIKPRPLLQINVWMQYGCNSNANKHPYVEKECNDFSKTCRGGTQGQLMPGQRW